MNDKSQLQEFLRYFRSIYNEGSLCKLSLSKVSNTVQDLRLVIITPLMLKSEQRLSFTYRYNSNDQVKNYSIEEAIDLLANLLDKCFRQAILIGEEMEYQLLKSKKGKYKLLKKKSEAIKKSINHNKEKKYLIDRNATYLKRLGVCDANGRIKDKQQDKFRQINRYVELMSHSFEKLDLSKKIKVIDVGSGKGYLTFALYDYLRNKMKIDVLVTGVELRSNLVELCNEISAECKFEGLRFISKDINEYESKEIDVIIALHACDIATDIAILKGVKADAELIVCAPCCHKQVRKDMNICSKFSSITRHGIFEERQAEMLTDAIRVLLMEKEGYQSKAFEFISNEHTRKNVMIVGIKSNSQKKVSAIEKEIQNLKDSFGIKRHELQDLLSQS